MFGLHLSLQLINMAIISAGVVLLLLNTAATRRLRHHHPQGPLLISMKQTWCCVNAFVRMTLAYHRLEFTPAGVYFGHLREMMGNIVSMW